LLKVGIIGLAQSGKTTLFRIMTHAHGTGLGSRRQEAHVGVVAVPDARLDRLTTMFNPRKEVHATFEYVDTPGSVVDLVRTGTESAVLREIQALVHVLKAFASEGDLVSELRRDIENVELELILSDLAIAEKRLERLEKEIKKQKNPSLEHELHALQFCKRALDTQKPLRELSLDAEHERAIRGFTFLSLKPLLYVINLDEKDAGRTKEAAQQLAAATGLMQHARTAVTAVCGKVESELAELSDQEAAEFMASFGLKQPAVDRVIQSSYGLLGLISFFTVGEDECRAWTLRSGASAWEAAGEIHSDIQRGFIRAEVVAYEDLIACGSLAEARNRGRLRLEGKDYVVKDGEVVHFRHSG
jgi:GTP-binding protein YchF